ncbi:hypothetical protein RI367_008334 [Sorochytrium milnesiophthora]
MAPSISIRQDASPLPGGLHVRLPLAEPTTTKHSLPALVTASLALAIQLSCSGCTSIAFKLAPSTGAKPTSKGVDHGSIVHLHDNSCQSQAVGDFVRAVEKAVHGAVDLAQHASWTGIIQGFDSNGTVAVTVDFSATVQQDAVAVHELQLCISHGDAAASQYDALSRYTSSAWELLTTAQPLSAVLASVQTQELARQVADLDIVRPRKEVARIKPTSQQDQDTVPRFQLLPAGLQTTDALQAVLEPYDLSLADVEDAYPATPMQEAMMAMTMQAPSMYLEQCLFDIDGDLDVRALCHAWEQVYQHCPMLRTRFVLAKDVGMLAVVCRQPAAPPHTLTATGDDLDCCLSVYQQQDQAAGCELGGPLSHIAVIQAVDMDHSVLVLTVHHSQLDGRSLGHVLTLLIHAYKAQVTPHKAPLPVVPQYQRLVRYLQSVDQSESYAFWRQHLEAAEVAAFPPEPPLTTTPGVCSWDELFVPVDTNAFKSASGSSMAMLFHLCYAHLLASYTNTRDVLFGTVVSTHRVPVPGIERTVGLCINTLPLRVNLGDATGTSVLQQLKALRATFGQVLKHSLINVRRLRQQLCDFAGVALFNSIVNYRGGKMATPNDDDLSITLSTRGFQHDMSYGLSLSADEVPNGLLLRIEYNHQVLSSAQARKILEQLREGIATASTHLGDAFSSEWFIPADTRSQLRQGIPSPLAAPPIHHLLHQLFEAAVESSPNATAIDSACTHQLTYAELNARANQLAHMLRDQYHVGPEVMVPLCLDKSIDMVVAMLAVLKAGGAYVPLDPKHPVERLQYIVANTGARVVLSHSQYAHLFGDCVLVLDNLDLTAYDSGNVAEPTLQPSSLAYVIYTSGSTGLPKGVMIEHQSAVASITVQAHHYGLDAGRRFLFLSNYAFDGSILEVFGALHTRGTVCLAPQSQLLERLSDHIVDMRVEHLFITPALLRLLDPSRQTSLRVMLVGGEKITEDLLRPWQPRRDTDMSLFQVYGPTENTVICMADRISCGSALNTAVIGVPIGATSAFVMSDSGTIAPVGAVGELWLGGQQLARGYLQDEAKTMAAFVSHPYAPGQRLYRTGDLVRQLPDGRIEILGRRDTQVKLNGQRIDTAEVDAAVMSSGATANAHTMLIDAHHGDATSTKKMLAVFVVPILVQRYTTPSVADGELLPLAQACIKTARAHAQSKLPPYMVPARWVPLTYMPLNGSGKIDRRALLQLLTTVDQAMFATFMGASVSTQAPVGDKENVLQRLWSKLLKVPLQSIGRDESFLCLGGDSITAIMLMQELRSQGYTLPVADIMQHPLLADMAPKLQVLAGSKDEAPPVEAYSLLGFPADPSILAKCRHDLEQLSIAADDVEDVLPASPMQEALVALNQQDRSHYLAQAVYQINRVLDVQRLESAWNTVIRHTPILRTTFMYSTLGGCLPEMLLLQVVRRPEASALALTVVRCGSDASQQLQEYQARDQALGVQLGQPFMRCALVIAEDAEQCYLVWTIHHALYDGWCQSQMLQDVLRAYEEIDLPKRLPYSHFIRHLQQQARPKALGFWRDYLDGAYPTDFDGRLGGAVQSRRKTAGPSSRARATRSVFIGNAKPSKCSIATLVKACWAIVLAAHSNSHDVLFGAITSGRDAGMANIANVMGPCINTLLTRVLLSDGSEAVQDLLCTLQQDSARQLQHSHLGLADVKQFVSGASSNTPLFHTLFNYLGSGDMSRTLIQELSVDGAVVTPVDGAMTMNYPITVEARSSQDTVHLSIVYTGEVDPVYAESILDSLCCVVEEVTSKPELRLDQVRLVNKSTELRLAQGITSSNVPVGSKHRFLHEIVETAAQRTPHAIAVDFEGAEQLTYAELNARANRLAHMLHTEHGVGPDVCVPLCLTKSVDMVVAILAVLKAGGAYVPLDPKHPPERLRYIVADVRAALVVSHSQCAPSFVCTQTLLLLDTIDTSGYPCQNMAIRTLQPNNLAYIIYTSGSTGVAKGVMVEHQAVTASVSAIAQLYTPYSPKRFLQFVNYAFDASVADFFVTFELSACLCMMAQDRLLADLSGAIAEMHVDAVYLTATVASLLQPSTARSLCMLVVGGEPVPSSLVKTWAERVHLLNVYGPTEHAIRCIGHRVSAADVPGSVIGRPFGSTTAFILDQQLRVVDVGCVGELCLAGPQLARGYLGDAEKTAAAFVVHPLRSNERVYRTGDLARLLPDGQIQILGRRDTQIKLNGLRVDTGEVDAAILSSGAVTHARAVPVSGATNQLVAFVAPRCAAGDEHFQHGAQLAAAQECIQQAAAHVAGKLPQHMLPAWWVPLARIPVNSNGKTDCRALQTLFTGLSTDQLLSWKGATRVKEAPRTDEERTLRTLWCQLFNLPASVIGRNDSFFDHGGDSITVIRLVYLCRAHGLSLSPLQIHETPILADLAACAQRLVPEQHMALASDASRVLLPIQTEWPSKPTLFIVHAVQGLASNFLTLRGRVTAANIIGMASPYLMSKAAEPPSTLAELAQAYCQAILNHQPHGPYYIGGYSFGGQVAMEIARLLQQSGRELRCLVLFDSHRCACSPVPAPSEADLRISDASVQELVAGVATTDLPLRDLVERETRRNLHLLRSHYPEPLPCPAYLLRAAHNTNSRASMHDPYNGWQTTLPSITAYDVPGHHFSMFEADYAPQLARTLDKVINQCTAPVL